MNRKESIRAAFSRAAGTYDAVGSVQRSTSLELARLIGQSIARAPLPSPRPAILEIGCGTGGLTAELARLLPAASITALDFSEPMLAVAREKLAGGAAGSPIDWRLADGELFEPPAGTRYDLIASSAALQWFDDLSTALRGFRERLKPDGRLAFAVFGRGTFGELQDAWSDAGPAGKPVAASSFLSPDEVAGLIEPLFPGAEVTTATSTRTFASLHELLVHFRTTGVSGGGRAGGLLSPSAIRRVERVYRERFGEIRATYQVVFAVARRRPD